MATLVEMRKEFTAKQEVLGQIILEAKGGGTDLDLSKVTLIKGTNVEKVEEIQRRNKELNALGAEIENLVEVDRIGKAHSDRGREWETPHTGMTHLTGKGKDGASAQVKSLGELFVDAKGHIKSGGIGPQVDLSDVDLKTTFSTTAGFAPETTRTGRLENTPERALVVADLLSSTTTTQAAIKYMKETTFTNAAVETSEGGTYQEGTLAYTEQTSVVQKLAVFLPVTDEQLEDVAMIQDRINMRLMRMLRERLDSQILVGNGSSPNLRGILNTSGIQTQAIGTDNVQDALFKAMTLVRFTGFAEPDAVILHPNDWQPIRLARTADGIYLWGSPSEAGPARIWGLPVVVTPAITENTGLVGAFREYGELALRRGISFQVSNSHGTYFTSGLQAIRADFRTALTFYRPSAFCKITGI